MCKEQCLGNAGKGNTRGRLGIPARREILQLYVFVGEADATHCSNPEQGSLFLLRSLFNRDIKSKQKVKKFKE